MEAVIKMGQAWGLPQGPAVQPSTSHRMSKDTVSIMLKVNADL